MLEGEAKLDSWRAERTGFPEVVFGPGKSAEQVAAIMRKMAGNEQVVMATRIAPEARPPAPCPVLDLMARLFGSDDRVAMAIRNPRHGVCLGVRACSAADQVSGLQHVHARPVEPAFRTAQGRMCVVGAVRAVSRRMRLRSFSVPARAERRRAHCASNTEALGRMPQVAAAVRALLPDIEYSAQARVLTLRGAQGGRRKQRRLPGAPHAARVMIQLGFVAADPSLPVWAEL